MSMDTEDILDKLFVDENAVNKELIFDILADYIQLTNNGSIVFLGNFNGLTNEKKIVLIMLARKVLALKGITTEFLSPSEVQNIVGLPKGTVNPTMTVLASNGYLRNDGGKYHVPNYAIIRIRDFIKRGGKNG